MPPTPISETRALSRQWIGSAVTSIIFRNKYGMGFEVSRQKSGVDPLFASIYLGSEHLSSYGSASKAFPYE